MLLNKTPSSEYGIPPQEFVRVALEAPKPVETLVSLLGCLPELEEKKALMLKTSCTLVAIYRAGAELEVSSQSFQRVGRCYVVSQRTKGISGLTPLITLQANQQTNKDTNPQLAGQNVLTCSIVAFLLRE